jgi:hypothetical protein
MFSLALVLRTRARAAIVGDEAWETVPAISQQENAMQSIRTYAPFLILAGAVLALGGIAIPSVAVPDDRVVQIASAHDTMIGFIEYETEGGKVRIPYTIKKKDMGMMMKMEAMKQAFIEHETQSGKVRVPITMMKAGDKMPAGMTSGVIEQEGEGGKKMQMSFMMKKEDAAKLKMMETMMQAFIEYETEGGKVRIPITSKKK